MLDKYKSVNPFTSLLYINNK